METQKKIKKGYFNTIYGSGTLTWIYGTWTSMYLRPLSQFLLKFIINVKWITPNIVTFFSFFIFVIGCILLFVNIPYHLYYAAFLIFFGYVGDLLDGDLASKRKIKFYYCGYIDHITDVFKMYFITISLSISVYIMTNKILFIFLGFTICAMFMSRFYIKQYVSKTVLINQIEKDPKFIFTRFDREKEWKQQTERKYATLSKSFSGKLKILWLKNKRVFLVDEAEIAIFTSVAAIFNQLVLWIWILVFFQTTIAIFRAFQRYYQLKNNDDKLIQLTSLEL